MGAQMKVHKGMVMTRTTRQEIIRAIAIRSALLSG